MAKRHILFVTQILPYPLDAGAKVRAYYMLRHLAERHQVTLVSLVRPTDPGGALAHLRQFCEVHTVTIRRSFVRDTLALFAGMATQQPVLIVRDRSKRFRQLIERLVGQPPRYDAVHVDQIKTAQHVAGIRSVPRLIDMHNVYCEVIKGVAQLTASPWRKRLLLREARTMERYESNVCRAFDEILAVAESDAHRLAEMIGHCRPVTPLPICIDPGETPMASPDDKSCDLLFVGAMFYPPNVDGVLWFLREMFPRIRREVPRAQFRVVGPRPDRAVLRAAAGDGSVSIAGYVEDPAPHFAASALTVVPLRAGSGMRVKILDAMARGVPVVSTRLGARGIAVIDGDNILLADGADEFAEAVLRFLRDVQLRHRMAQNARRLVETRYDWRQRYREVDVVYQRLLER